MHQSGGLGDLVDASGLFQALGGREGLRVACSTPQSARKAGSGGFPGVMQMLCQLVSRFGSDNF